MKTRGTPKDEQAEYLINQMLEFIVHANTILNEPNLSPQARKAAISIRRISKSTIKKVSTSTPVQGGDNRWEPLIKSTLGTIIHAMSAHGVNTSDLEKYRNLVSLDQIKDAVLNIFS
jgi:hypothetical protein